MEADHEAFAQRAVAIGAAPSRHSDIRSGDRVGLFVANYTQYLECFDGIWRVNLGRA
jgi:acyl-CoA synthetase (AMP-forming)/AMP-acid ligase II